MNLIQRGANVNELSGFLDKNPLHLACEYGHFSCARLLANSDNINLDSCGEYINGSTALHICAEFNQIDIMKMLVTKGANIEKLGRFSTIGTPLHIASLKGNIHAVNELIQLGANINSRDELNNTPLHVACQYNKYDIAFMLIDLDADINLKADTGKIAIDLVHVPTIKEKLKNLGFKCYQRRQAKIALELLEKRKEMERIAEEKAEIERKRLLQIEKLRLKVEKTKSFLRKLRAICDISGEVIGLLGLFTEYSDEDINGNINILMMDRKINDNNDDKNKGINENLSRLNNLINGVSTTNNNTVVDVVAYNDNHYDKESNDDDMYEYDNDDLYIDNNRNLKCTALTRACKHGFYDLVHALLRWPNININIIDEPSRNSSLHIAAINHDREIIEELLVAGCKNTLINLEGKVAANLVTTSYLREILRNPLLISDRKKYQDKISDHLFLQAKVLNINTSSSSSDSTDSAAVVATSTATLTLKDTLELNKYHTYEMNLNNPTINHVGHVMSHYHDNRSRSINDYYNHNTTTISTSPIKNNTTIATTNNVLVNTNSKLPSLPLIHKDKNNSTITPIKLPVKLSNLSFSAVTKEDSIISGFSSYSSPFNNTKYNNDLANDLVTNHENQTISSTDGFMNIMSSGSFLPLPAKYGTIPQSFGGSNGDFFFLDLNIYRYRDNGHVYILSAEHDNNNKYNNSDNIDTKNNNNMNILPQNYHHIRSSSTSIKTTKINSKIKPSRNKANKTSSMSSSPAQLFLDLLNLQLSYTPTAFDNTEEWNEIRDFLWMFSYPYKLTSSSSSLSSSSNLNLIQLSMKLIFHAIYDDDSIRIADDDNDGGGANNDGSNFPNFNSNTTSNEEIKNNHHNDYGNNRRRMITRIHPVNQLLQSIIIENKMIIKDKRTYYYFLSCLINEIQSTFTNLINFDDYINTNQNVYGTKDGDESYDGDKTLKLPKILSKTKLNTINIENKHKYNSNKKNFDDDITINKKLNREQQLYSICIDIHLQQYLFNINNHDKKRILLFSMQCEMFLEILLLIYQPSDTLHHSYYQEWYYSNNNEYSSIETIRRIKHNILILYKHQIINKYIEKVLNKLMMLSFSFYLSLIEQNIHNYITSNTTNTSTNNNDPRNININDKYGDNNNHYQNDAIYKQHLDYIHLNYYHFFPLSQISHSQSSSHKDINYDIYNNPPRYLRICIDYIYEILEYMKANAEQTYALDTVRGHLWAFTAKEIMKQQKALFLNKIKGGNIDKSSSISNNIITETSNNKSISNAKIDNNHNNYYLMEGDENLSLLSNDHSIVDQLIVYDNEHSNNTNEYNNSNDSNVVILSEESSVISSAVSIDNNNIINNNDAVINNINKNITNLTNITYTKNQLIYKYWLEKLYLFHYQSYFIEKGFQVVSDFIGLTDDDCCHYFPFLKIGDLRRLINEIKNLNDLKIQQLEDSLVKR